MIYVALGDARMTFDAEKWEVDDGRLIIWARSPQRAHGAATWQKLGEFAQWDVVAQQEIP